MEGSFRSPPGKRSIHRVNGVLHTRTSNATANGASFKRSKPPPPPLTVGSGNVLFRLLCQSTLAGGVIGTSGAIIKQLQHDAGAKIRVDESPPGVDERIIIIIASSSVNKKITLTGSKGEEEEEIEVSAAQGALIRVFDRILDVAEQTEKQSVAAGGSLVSCKVLAESSQVGAVIGKGGKVIEQLRKDTGCKIKIVSSDQLPACCLPNDEVVEIEGSVLAVKKALVGVSRCLQDSPPLERAKPIGRRPFESITQSGHQVGSALPPMSNSGTRSEQQEVEFRLLCSNDTAGGVIGRAGTIVTALQNETGASIDIAAPVHGCDERLITITTAENPESQRSPAQNAVVLVFNRSIEAGIEKGLLPAHAEGVTVFARLVVPSNQVGCLLRQGGAIMSEIRRTTGADIHFLGRDQIPKCISESDEVVQITGEFVNVKDALYNVTGRLRDNLFRGRISSSAATWIGASRMPNINPHERDPSYLGLHSSMGVSRNLNDHTFVPQSMDRFGPPHDNGYNPSQRLWESQVMGGVNPRGIYDAGRGPVPGRGGMSLGSGIPAIVTNTTMEIPVPESVIGSIYGENGGNLARVRQISGARVSVHEPRPGTRDAIVVISGTPDEAQAAQSLIQAFIINGRS